MGEKRGIRKFWWSTTRERNHLEDLDLSWPTFLRARVKKFEESLLHGHGHFEDQNKFLEPSIIIINYFIIILNPNYNYIT